MRDSSQLNADIMSKFGCEIFMFSLVGNVSLIGTFVLSLYLMRDVDPGTSLVVALLLGIVVMSISIYVLAQMFLRHYKKLTVAANDNVQQLFP